MTPGNLPPPDAPYAPWFVYRTAPGRIHGQPYSRKGWIAMLALMIAPLVIGLAVIFALTPGPLVMVAIILTVVAFELGSIFLLIFRFGRRVP